VNPKLAPGWVTGFTDAEGSLCHNISK
jgi:hypothetical protein